MEQSTKDAAGDLDTQSISSAAPSDVSKGKKKGSTTKSAAELDKELKREKKFKKLLKEALEEEKEKVKTLQKEIEWCNLKNQELENENRDQKPKYHDLYMENSQQHEVIVQLQSRNANAQKENPFLNDVRSLISLLVLLG